MKSSDLGKELIKKELALIPKSPGVYRMLNHKGNLLYVGKAKNLPNRLKSYVLEKNHIIRTERMLSQTHNIEVTTTANESEALLLEANLIKKFKPKFNILLKDDKSFPFIYVGNKDKWPQLTKHRGKKIRMVFILVHLHQLVLQIGQSKCFKKYFKSEFAMKVHLKIESDLVFYTKSKDVLHHVLDILIKLNIKTQLKMQ